MTEETLKKLREVILQKKENIEAQNGRIDRIKALEENPLVKEYMQLRNLSSIRPTKQQVNDGMYYLAYEECKPKGLYPTVGMYVVSHSGKYFSGFRIKNYKQYTNIESFDENIVSSEFIESFESENVVLEGIELIDAHKEFLKLAVEQGQEEAVKVMSKKYGSKKEGK